jgi:hypothetical protein
MGYTTDFIGHIEIDPPLNVHEQTYLAAFHQSRRFDRGGDPYAVPGNPAAERDREVPIDVYNSVAVGQPGLWCRWSPCWEGCCLSLDGGEKIYDAGRWLEYLIAHLLSPDAAATELDHPELQGFTFDHVLNGLVIGCRRDTKEMFALLVEDNHLRDIVLKPGDPRYGDYPPLPYEEENDRWAPRPPRPRSRAVLDLARRQTSDKGD